MTIFSMIHAPWTNLKAETDEHTVDRIEKTINFKATFMSTVQSRGNLIPSEIISFPHSFLSDVVISNRWIDYYSIQEFLKAFLLIDQGGHSTGVIFVSMEVEHISYLQRGLSKDDEYIEYISFLCPYLLRFTSLASTTS